MSDQAVHVPSAADAPRRDFLLLVAEALGGVGLVSALWPFVDSLEPAEDTLAAGAPIDVDLAPVKPGQQMIAKWRGRPIFIVRRTPDELKMLQNAADTSLLRDPNSAETQQPSYAKNWHRSATPEYLVLVGICTHLGCIPEFKPKDAQVGGPSWPGGYFCPCHGSKYDLAGRVFSGVPAPYNLPVPPYHFTAKDKIRIGENPKDKDANYSLSDVEQI